jgi:hypothetical protein
MTRALAILTALAALLIAPFAAAQISPAPQKIVTPVDPLTMGTDNFTRLADPDLWKGLSIHRIEFRDARTFWRVYRVMNLRKPNGPLWFVPHDNENAAFQAAILAVRSYGGVVVAVEEARSLAGPDSRMNGDVAFGRPVDPNRNFRDDTPDYARTILADLGSPARLIIALHTNQAGFDAAESECAPDQPETSGSGEISVLLCSDLYLPRPSIRAAWPYDDTDSVAIVAFAGDRSPATGFCSRALADADMNIMFERVVKTDGSLSNYALYRGLPYVNLETQDRGVEPVGLGDARARLLAMIDVVMARCSTVDGLALRTWPPRPLRPAKRRPR